MPGLTRRSLLQSGAALAAGALAAPRIANAQATTATVWWTQGFAQEEDVAFRKMVADYEKASGNKIDDSIIPFAPLRQKEISAITSGVVPDMMEYADFELLPINAWEDKLVDVSDVVQTQKSHLMEAALKSTYCYNNARKKRAYYGIPMKAAGIPFRYWRSLIEKAGFKDSDIPNKWDAFIDFFKPVQDKLRAQGMRNIYAYGYQLTATGVDPHITFQGYMNAYGGKDLVTPDGRVHTGSPQIKEAAIKALEKLTTPYKQGYVPPGVTGWNDADDNNAFHSKLIVMDYDGSLSTEVALYKQKDQYDDIVTYGLPLGNDGKPVASPLPIFGALIPKGAKNVELAKEFAKYMIEPKVLNEYLKGGLGRWMIPMPEMTKSEPFWRDPKDPHVVAYTKLTIDSPTIALYEAFNPAFGQINTEEVFSLAEFDVMKNGMTPEAAIAKAFERIDEVFAKFPIQQA
jgi:multiple sugar transport system substrate-binding protein